MPRYIAIDTLAHPESVVNVTVPAKAWSDLAAFNKITASVLGRLGCPGCHSGRDIRFDLGRSFAVDENLNIRDAVPGIVGR